MFYIGYILAEIPSSMLNKIVGPGRYLPLLVFLFVLLPCAPLSLEVKEVST